MSNIEYDLTSGENFNQQKYLKIKTSINSLKNKELCSEIQTSHDFLDGITKNSGRFFNDIPKDPRTLLSTPRRIDIVEKCSGQYIYFGLENGICESLNEVMFNIDECVEVDINVDGLPLYKSSNLQFLPILCRVVKYFGKPFVVAIYCGMSKPSSVDEFLGDFVLNANNLIKYGLYVNGKHINIKIRAFICDAPARAFIKCIAGHTSKNGCERCTSVGIIYHRRIVLT
ncbi:uncharacterized protein LOC136073076 [Hydra vulgaris]|uniref:uncharacterized protein LOC136073076 n=1 Tax=Hydra vulgaris TaxID=6087 RepID=UPI0032EA3283